MSPRSHLVLKVIRPHGVKGELKVVVLTDYPENIKEGRLLYLDAECSPKAALSVERFRTADGNYGILKLAGVDDRTAAESLRSKGLYLSELDFPKLRKDEYWVDEIIGLTVVDDEGREIGKVKDVLRGPAHDVLEIDGADGGELFVPMVRDFVAGVELESGRIRLKRKIEAY